MSYTYQYESELHHDLTAQKDGKSIISDSFVFPTGINECIVDSEYTLDSGNRIDIFIQILSPHTPEIYKYFMCGMVVELKRGDLKMHHVEQVLKYTYEAKRESPEYYDRLFLPILIGVDASRLLEEYHHIINKIDICIAEYTLCPWDGLKLDIVSGDYPDEWLERILFDEAEFVHKKIYENG